MGYSDWHHMDGAMGSIGWGAGGLIVLVFVLAAVGIIAMLAKGVSSRPSQLETPRARSALDVLKERYARGEIGRDEFERKNRDLR